MMDDLIDGADDDDERFVGFDFSLLGEDDPLFRIDILSCAPAEPELSLELPDQSTSAQVTTAIDYGNESSDESRTP